MYLQWLWSRFLFVDLQKTSQMKSFVIFQSSTSFSIITLLTCEYYPSYLRWQVLGIYSLNKKTIQLLISRDSSCFSVCYLHSFPFLVVLISLLHVFAHKHLVKKVISGLKATILFYYRLIVFGIKEFP